MDKLIALGTGYAVAINCYTTCFALNCDDDYFLLDTGGGNGILKRLAQAEIDPARLHHVFISHRHTDHVLGALWLMRLIGHQLDCGQYDGQLTFYAHAAVCQGLEAMGRFVLPEKHLAYFHQRIVFMPIEDGQQHTILKRKVQFFDTAAQKTQQFGLKITLDNDKTLVYLGDEPFNERNYALVHNADYLLHEAFCRHAEVEKYRAARKAHSTVKEACDNARLLNAKALILFHTEDHDLTHRKKNYTDEAHRFFDGQVFVPDDLDCIWL